jgi:3',5'-cyclic AMP phosphodiesterase CpdA
MRFIHFSDLHLNGLYKRNNVKKFKSALKSALENGFDHLVITGDLADNAEEKEFMILRNILHKYNLLDPKLVTIIIGNHDIFGGVQTALDVVDFPKKCKNTDYEERVNRFIGYFDELFTDTYSPVNIKSFPFVKFVGEHALIGINSVDRYSTLKNPFASNGKVSDNQIEHLKKIFTLQEVSDKKKIVLIHHHFYKKNVESTASQNHIWNKIESFTMKLRKKKKLIQLFQEYDVKLVLHGHSHEIKDYHRKGIRFLNAGASIDNGSELSQYFQIDSVSDEFQVKSIEYYRKKLSPITINLPKITIPKIAGDYST